MYHREILKSSGKTFKVVIIIRLYYYLCLNCLNFTFTRSLIFHFFLSQAFPCKAIQFIVLRRCNKYMGVWDQSNDVSRN